MGKVLLLDIDSTLNNFQEYFLTTFKSRFPEYQNIELKTHYDAMKLNRERGMSILIEDGFTSHLRPLDGAVDAVKYLEKKGYDIYFCTSLVTDTSNAMRDRVQWIGHWFGQKWMNKMIFTSDKTMVKGDFLIDDSPFKSKGKMKPSWKLIIFDVDYNVNDECYGRIYNWKDLDKLNRLLEN